MLVRPEVRRAMELVDRVGAERHLLSGFLRFQETHNGVFYAPCSPDNDVVDLPVSYTHLTSSEVSDFSLTVKIYPAEVTFTTKYRER